MLSRVAESFYWLARNVERAESVARILDVNYVRAMDLYATHDGRSERLWRSVLRCAGFMNDPASEPNLHAAAEALTYCAFAADNASSIRSCVRIARSNALAIRAELATEVWETVNVLYLFVESSNASSVLRAGPSRFLRRIRDATQALAGVADAVLSHGEGWNFLQVGRFLERAYMTARVLAAIEVDDEPWAESQRLLEMCCASEPFAKGSSRSPEARDAVDFVVLAADFPRSLRFCTREVDRAMHRITFAPHGTFANDAERRLGRLRARFDFTPLEELLVLGPHAFATEATIEFEELGAAIETTYFPRLPRAVAG
jgi:uncharacterized alpha-E superfamily protein